MKVQHHKGVPPGPRRGAALRSPSSSENGFTLLEMMVVIVLMGTIAAVALPRFKSLFEVSLKSSMRTLAGTIKFCFNESIIKQSVIRLNFDVERGIYYHSTLITDPESITGEFVPVPSPISSRQALPEGVYFEDILTPRSQEKLAEGETFIMFYPTGYAEKAVIHLRDEAGNQYTMLIKPLTGGMQIFDGYVDFAVFENVQTPFGTSSETFER